MAALMLLRPIETWPGSLRRESDRVATPFTATWSATMDLLRSEIEYLAGRDAEFVVQIAARPDAFYRDGSGLTARFRDVEHPGVVVSFTTSRGRPLQFATDVHTSRGWGGYLPGWQSNVRAVALALEALRKVDRYGVGTAEQQYVGWQALPPGTPMPRVGAMSLDEAARLIVAHADGLVDVADLLDENGVDVLMVKRVFRDVARRLHPDQGGDPDLFRQLLMARDLLDPKAAPVRT